MRIAVISMIRDSWGGSEELWYEMAKQALAKGHEMIQLAFEHPSTHPKITELQKLGLKRLVRPGYVPSNAGKLKELSAIGKNYIRRKISSPILQLLKLQPDIILYNGTCYSIKYERELLAQLRKRDSVRFFIIGHLNSNAEREMTADESNLVRAAYSRCEEVFFVSMRSIDTAQRHLCSNIPNAALIRNPVNLLSTEAVSFPSFTNGIHLAVVGNLITVHKGQDLLIEALGRWSVKTWTLNIYGSGPDKGYLEKLTRHFGLENQIVFHGVTSDIRAIWSHNHMLILPSHREGMPLAIVEAMVCGRPCMATDVGGVTEWLEHDRNGFILANNNIASIIKCLDHAYARRNAWAEMGQSAYETAIKLMDPNPGGTLLNRIIAE